MVAGEVLLEGEAGLLSLFYNSTNKCWKVDLKMRLNWTILTVMTLLPVFLYLLKIWTYLLSTWKQEMLAHPKTIFSLRSVPSSPGEGATGEDCQPKVPITTSPPWSFLIQDPQYSKLDSRSFFSSIRWLWPLFAGPPHTNCTAHWLDLAVGQLCAPSSPPPHPPTFHTLLTKQE